MKSIIIGLLLLVGVNSFACSPWVNSKSICSYGDMKSGYGWTRSCPDTVCARNGRYINHVPCDNEQICMPQNQIDGPQIPGVGVPDVQTDPNKLDGTCQLWYPVKSVNAGQAGCGKGEIIWTRECQAFGGDRTLPTKTCSAGYPSDT